jgi:MFS superfamily sulfate permease-like transporter
VPWALLVLVAATAVVLLNDLADSGVKVLGAVESGAPSLTWPEISWHQWLTLVPSAIALTLVTTAEGLLVSRNYGEKREYRTDPNQDLLAFGAGNLAAGVSGGFAIGSSTSRTAAMDQTGSRTQLPSVVTAIGTLILLLVGTSLLEDIPSPAIGAIVGVAILPLLGVKEFRELWATDRAEFAIGAVCFLVTLFVGSIAGIVVAFVFALVNLARRAANPAIDVLQADGNPGHSLLTEAPEGEPTVPGVVVIRMAAPLFFANGVVFGDAVKRAVNATDGVLHVVVDMEAVTDVDVTGAEAFEALREWLRAKGVELSFSRVRADARDRLEHLGLLTEERVFETNREAVSTLGPT